MDSLRERVAKAMHECHPENDPKPWDWVVTDATRYAESIRQDADAAIAAFEAALLSDEVVESAARAIHGASPWAGCPFVLGVWSKDARAALQAALAAAKGTEGGGRVMDSDLINVEIRCTHCMRKERARVRSEVPIHDLPLPQGWRQVVVIDPIRGAELVRTWEATLCPECAAIETTTVVKGTEGSA